jgi:hypothetical protein
MVGAGLTTRAGFSALEKWKNGPDAREWEE